MTHDPGTGRQPDAGAGTLASLVARLAERQRLRAFRDRTWSALSELGLDRAHLIPHARKLLGELCERGHAQPHASPDALAVEFFLRATIEYSKLIGRPSSCRGLLMSAPRTLRVWQLVDRLDARLVEAGIARIRASLCASLESLEMDPADRRETLEQIAAL